jgi:hypothetical protein
VVKVVDGLPEQVLGEFPQGISLEEADGNSVILDIGGPLRQYTAPVTVVTKWRRDLSNSKKIAQ